ncbi:hypothetical protein [Xanthovirga aplysinae]|uniref:hypothetical protein n=1 Tax=Xanthovirga aplysinae TaxID=2529853 RepID=UPI0012BB8D9E|nr:hypothetical protein [Xanthovirga aplysinae]MTI32532.1 hypothetical protein [Xanthovirga aplysinae]
MTKYFLFLLLLIGSLIISNGCSNTKKNRLNKKIERLENKEVKINQKQRALIDPKMKALRKLHHQFERGSIDLCLYNGDTIYAVQRDALGANVILYDVYGDKITTCDYGYEKVAIICNNLRKCETIYRIKNNVWKLPAVNKYNLQ